MHFAVHPLVKLISEGEGERLDFKKTISSARKIARTLVAFANTHGGSLLVGVRDNGTVAGIRLEEEMYMVDSAAKVFCDPPVRYEYRLHDYKGLTVLQVVVPESLDKPHLAKSEPSPGQVIGEWQIFVRVNDKSVLASPMVAEVLRRRTEGRDTRIQFTDLQRSALSYLADHPAAQLPAIARHLLLTQPETADLLTDLACAGLVDIINTEKAEEFVLAEHD